MYNVHVVDDAGMLSCRHGQMKCLRILLERGAVVVSDKAGVSPLQLCAEVNCKCQINHNILHVPVHCSSPEEIYI